MAMIRGKHWAFHPAAGEPWVVRACHRCGYATAHCECTVVDAGSGRAKPPPPTSTPDLVHIIFGLFDHDRDGALDQREYGLFLCETDPENHALDLEKRWETDCDLVGADDTEPLCLADFRLLYAHEAFAHEVRQDLTGLGYQPSAWGRRRVEGVFCRTRKPWVLGWDSTQKLWFWAKAGGSSWLPQRAAPAPSKRRWDPKAKAWKGGKEPLTQKLQRRVSWDDSALKHQQTLEASSWGGQSGGRKLRKAHSKISSDFVMHLDSGRNEFVFIRKTGPRTRKHRKVLSVICGYDTRLRPQERKFIATGPGNAEPLRCPSGLAHDPLHEQVFIAEHHCIRMVPDGLGIPKDGDDRDDEVKPEEGGGRIIAGTRTTGLQDGPGDAARFNGPHGLWFDLPTRRLFVADCWNHCIRCLTEDQFGVAGSSWSVTTIAGVGYSTNLTGRWLTSAALDSKAVC